MTESDPFAVTDAALQTKTGRSLAQWIEIARSSPDAGHMATVSWLKTQHGLGHGHANTVVHALNDTAAASHDGDDLVEAMFAGPKSALRPLHEKILTALESFGPDVELSPKKGYVSFRRSKQFGLGQPSTKDRYDLGLVLKGEHASGRLEMAGSWNTMVTHRLRLVSPEDVNAELIGWLRAAYDRA